MSPSADVADDEGIPPKRIRLPVEGALAIAHPWQVRPTEHAWQAVPKEPQLRVEAPPWQRPAESQQPVAQVELSQVAFAGPHPVISRSDAPSASETIDLCMVLA